VVFYFDLLKGFSPSSTNLCVVDVRLILWLLCFKYRIAIYIYIYILIAFVNLGVEQEPRVLSHDVPTVMLQHPRCNTIC
jgi:hypothetical protein